MGNVEKWVVLGVLALIVGILVISLNVDDPLKKDQAVLAGSSAEPAPAPKPALLSSNVETTAPPAAAAPAPTPIAASAPIAPALPAGSILKTTEGLQESYMTDAMFYTWKAGDTFPALAQRFYADPSRLATLKRLNEGRTEVQPGERVLVPIFDLDAGEPRTSEKPPTEKPAAPAMALKTEPAAKPAASPAAKSDVVAPAATSSGSKVHVVKEGESLWKIAKQELGSGARWNEIYTANRDVLSSPEAVHTGQKLRVP